MSGTSLLRARSPELLERSFARVTDIFGINDLSGQEQVQHLLQLPIHELRAQLGRQLPLGPMVDGDMIHETTTFQALAGRSGFERLFPGAGHCKRILVGDCQMDVRRSPFVNHLFIYLFFFTGLTPIGRSTCSPPGVSHRHLAPNPSQLSPPGLESHRYRYRYSHHRRIRTGR